MSSDTYIIQGGAAGRERLRLLARVMAPTTTALLDRVRVPPGIACLDIGCGGGDVTRELARRVGPTGAVVGCDIDAVKVEMARRETEAEAIDNVSFRVADINDDVDIPEPRFDLVYARFLLTHLRDPAAAVIRMRQFLRPGGTLVVEDIDFSGHFCHPGNAAHDRYVRWYQQSVQRRGAAPNIGPSLPGFLTNAGLQRIAMNVVQPAAFDGEVKQVAAITLENIAQVVLDADLATADEIQQTLSELHSLAADRSVVVSLPRIVQAWGYQVE